jgi:RHS repeat-associated protein
MRKLAFFLAIVLLSSLSAYAQTTGTPPFSSLSRSGFDVINNQNLNAYFSIPVFSSAGRGMPLTLNLANNSLIWQPVLVGSTTTWTPVADVNGNPTWGWQKDMPPGGTVNYQTTSSQVKCFTSGNNWYWATITHYRYYSYIDVYGTGHGFGISIQESDCPLYNTGGTFTGSAGDASGYYMDATNPVAPKVTSASGIQGVNGSGTSIDTNGNYVTKTVVSSTETDWTDSVGNKALKILYTGSSSNPTQIQYYFLDGTGSSNYQIITLKFIALSIKTNFGCTGVGEYTSPGSVYLPQELDIPSPVSGTISYKFTYEPTPGHSGYYTGRINTVTLPTGGSYEYDYTGSYDGINCADGTTLGINRKITNGSDNATWNFVRNTTNSTTTVTTPELADTSSANDALYTFNGSAQESSRIIYSNHPGTTVLRTINTTWATNGTPATQVTILEDPNQTQSKVTTSFDLYGNLLSEAEYDWGAGAPGGLIRTTSLTYMTTSPYTSRNIVNLLTQKQITDSTGAVQYLQNTAYDGATLTCTTGAAQHDDTDFPCSMVYRGDPTSVTTYQTPAGPSGPITKNFTYDWFGNLLTAQVNCCQLKTWAYTSTTQYSQPDSETSGSSSPQLTMSATYNIYTGRMVTSTDANGQVTHYGYDFLRRPTSVERPDGTTISQSYSDTSFTSTVAFPIDSSGDKIQQISAVDSLGSPNLSTIEDGVGNVYSAVATSNSLLGRQYQTSNPYTSGSPSNWTVSKFDALGRLMHATLPDSSVNSYSYSANTVTVTDPSSKKRESVVDAAGRLTSVYEPDSSNSLTVLTSYAYTVLNGLATVTEGSQTRTYTYDGLGRLLTRAEPEIKNAGGQGQYQYVYNSYDLVTQRTDPRGVITTYGYDNLNRLHTVSYNVGSTGVATTAGVTLTYGTTPSSNNNGRLTVMADGTGSENYSYDILGRLTQMNKVIGSQSFPINYQYNLGNELTQITYPSGRVVQQAVDPIGRLCAIAQTASSCTSNTNPYANTYQYNAAFQLTSFNYGNGVAASFVYSPDRLQLTSLSYVKGASTLFSLNYWYKLDPTNCPAGTTNNNGQIQCITDNVDNGRTEKYSYDNLGRLLTAQTTGSSGYAAWGLSMTYDRYGNRWGQAVTAGTAPSSSVSVDYSSNRITTTGYSYDSNGNMTNDGSNTLTYDAENRAVTTNGNSGTYTYDGNNLRVTKSSGATSTVYIYSGGTDIAEYQNGALPSAPTNEYVYSGNQIVAGIQSGSTYYFHYDQLSPRVRTTSSGSIYDQKGTYPFGETWYATISNPEFDFTNYQRDSESGNDYAYARFYVNRLGRFSSPDLVGGSVTDPRSINRYSYVVNDASNSTDPTGLCPSWGPLTVRGKVLCTSASGPTGGSEDDALGPDAGIYSGFSFWDLLAGGVIGPGVSFGSDGNIQFLPPDWGSPKYNGSEQFAPTASALFQNLLVAPSPQTRDNGFWWSAGMLQLDAPGFLLPASIAGVEPQNSGNKDDKKVDNKSWGKCVLKEGARGAAIGGLIIGAIGYVAGFSLGAIVAGGPGGEAGGIAGGLSGIIDGSLSGGVTGLIYGVVFCKSS